MEQRFLTIAPRNGIARLAGGKLAAQCRCAMKQGRWTCLYIICALTITCSGQAIGQSSAAGMPRVGLLVWSSCDELSTRAEFGWFLDGLSEFGYRPGETVVYECRSAGGRYNGLASAAAALV